MKPLIAGVIVGSGLVLFHIATSAPGSNPAVVSERTIQAHVPVPGHISQILTKACRDCHSNATRWPWYASVRPLAGLLIREVERGRNELNFSEWGAQAGRTPPLAVGTLAAICDAVKERRMPPRPYRLLHPAANLTQADVDAVCFWTTGQIHTIRARTAALPPERVRSLFAARGKR